MNKMPNSLKGLLWAVLLVGGLVCLILGMAQVHNNMLTGISLVMLGVVGAVIVNFFFEHRLEAKNSSAPTTRLFSLFAVLCLWVPLVPMPMTQAGSFLPMTMAISFGAIAGLAEIFWSSRPMWYRKEIFTPIFWTSILIASYVFLLVAGGPWILAKMILSPVLGILLICLIPAVIKKIKANLNHCLDIGGR